MAAEGNCIVRQCLHLRKKLLFTNTKNILESFQMSVIFYRRKNIKNEKYPAKNSFLPVLQFQGFMQHGFSKPCFCKAPVIVSRDFQLWV